MNKNYQFEKLIKLLKKSLNNSPQDSNIVAKSENNNEVLYYFPDINLINLSIIRENFSAIINQPLDKTASFDFKICEYNGKAPYLEISLGKMCTNMYFI